MQKIVIIGAGGFAREVLDVIDAVNARAKTFDFNGFIVDEKYRGTGKKINGFPVLGDLEWLSTRREELQAICAIGDPQVRFQKIQRAEQLGIQFFTVIHPNAIYTKWVEFGIGTVVTAGCIITNQITIGNHVHLNLDCTVGHDSIIHDYVTISPGVHVSGNVIMGTGTFVGTGANILEKITIGEWSTIGAGSTVIKDIPANVTAVGTPASVVNERKSGWYLNN